MEAPPCHKPSTNLRMDFDISLSLRALKSSCWHGRSTLRFLMQFAEIAMPLASKRE